MRPCALALDDIRRQVDARTSRPAPLSESSEVPFSEESRHVLRYAAQEAERLLHRHIGTEHLLLGLFREERGTAASILDELGLRLTAVRDQLVDMLSGSTLPPFGLRFGVAVAPRDAGRLRISPTRREVGEGPQVVWMSLRTGSRCENFWRGHIAPTSGTWI